MRRAAPFPRDTSNIRRPGGTGPCRGDILHQHAGDLMADGEQADALVMANHVAARGMPSSRFIGRPSAGCEPSRMYRRVSTTGSVAATTRAFVAPMSAADRYLPAW